MDKNAINKLIQENIVYLLIPVILFGAGVYFSIGKISNVLTNINALTDKKQEKMTK